MAKQIRFFKKNIIDLSSALTSITVTDSVATDNGQSIVDFIRNRNNYSAWVTTNSTDAANTQLDIDFGVGRDVSDILLVKHNWKAFTIKYWNGTTYVDFSTPIAETVNDDETTHFQFDSVETQKLRIIITAAQTLNADKELYQLIVTEQIGLLNGWPVIKNPTHDRNKKISKMLSGKVNVIESLGSFQCDLEVTNWKNQADLTVIEEIYFRREGVLIWLCGGDEDQFSMELQGYRLEDIFLVRPTNSYEPEWAKGIYTSGVKLKIALQEAIE